METVSETAGIRKGGGLRLMAGGLLAGIASGVVASLYRLLLTYVDAGRGIIFSLADKGVWGIVLLFAVLLGIGALTGIITQSEPLIRGSGIPQVEGQLLGRFKPVWWMVLIKKFAGGTLAMLCGLSLGREGPSIQLGAMSADGLSGALRYSEDDRKYLIVCGACGGLAAAFNAPLSGVMFALEEVHHRFSRKTLFPAMLSALSATVVARLIFGTGSVLGLHEAVDTPIQYYALYIAFGVVTGLASALYNKTLIATQSLYAKIKLPVWTKIMIPFAFAGIFGLVLPEVLGSGHSLIDSATAMELTIGAMALLLAAKFAFSMLSFCSGAPGGIFFPLLVLGALIGGIFGLAAVKLAGMPEDIVFNFVLLGMTGMFAGIVRAPVTGIILIMEMTGSLNQLMELAIVACISAITANLIKSRPIYEELLDRMTPAGVSPAGVSPAGVSPAGVSPAGVSPAGVTSAGVKEP